MKFARELDNDIVQEWRAKYVDYRSAKHQIRGIARAVNRLHPNSRKLSSIILNNNLFNHRGTSNTLAPNNQPPAIIETLDGSNYITTLQPPKDEDYRLQHVLSPLTIPSSDRPASRAGVGKHESFSVSPTDTRVNSYIPVPNFLQILPSNGRNTSISSVPEDSTTNPTDNCSTLIIPVPMRFSSAYNARGSPISATRRLSKPINNRNSESPKSTNSEIRPSMFHAPELANHRTEVNAGAADVVKQRQANFFKWIDDELGRVEAFYKEKEDESAALISDLQLQLREMRNRRIQELADALNSKDLHKKDDPTRTRDSSSSTLHSGMKIPKRKLTPPIDLVAMIDSVEGVVGKLKQKILNPRLGANSKALQNMQNSPGIVPPVSARSNDFLPSPRFAGNVPYRTAKKKLKLVLLEAYRAIELLRSYSLINRAAFRKINRKYSKTVDPHHLTRLSHKVDMAWFVRSDLLDVQVQQVVDLYAEYFECGQRKIAIGKLRRPLTARVNRTAPTFRSGLLIGIGAIFSTQAVIHAVELLHDPDPKVRVQTGLLLQLYAGFFLLLYMFAFFCFDCYIWMRNKINYPLIFDIDSRHVLDWRELIEIPSTLMALLGLCAWLNFYNYGTSSFFIYWPVILASVVSVLLFFPARITHYRGRRWLAYSHWRLFLAGVYPVEFRDFFLGDIYCSLTYFMANIEVFFCLYIHHWNAPAKCGSSHSITLGFLTTLPGIWRTLQCLRRYNDTGDMFPHLVNCGKYFTIITYLSTLSLYRRDRIYTKLVIFLAAASLQSIYGYIWDILMDWSLLQSNAKKRFLRDVRGFEKSWFYYSAIALNAVLRLGWIFFAIYPEGVGHSSLVTFFVALMEATRRGMWVIFRVENEHCSNVAGFKASRNLSLPYATNGRADDEIIRPEVEPLTKVPLQMRNTRIGSGRIGRSITNYVANAHEQDFERKRNSDFGERKNSEKRYGTDQDSDAESSDDDYNYHNDYNYNND